MSEPRRPPDERSVSRDRAPPPPPRALTAAKTKERVHMYGHPPHTGIGSFVLTLVASAKGGIGYLVRVIAHAQHHH